MFKLEPFRAEHILPLLDQPINGVWREKYLGTAGLLGWLETQVSFTGSIGGKTVVCGGVTQYWPGRGHIWTMFSEESKVCFVPVFRGIRRFLKDQLKENFHRIEVSIPCDFSQGRRRAELLGFRLECGFAEKYMSDGADAALYSMVRR